MNSLGDWLDLIAVGKEEIHTDYIVMSVYSIVTMLSNAGLFSLLHAWIGRDFLAVVFEWIDTGWVSWGTCSSKSREVRGYTSQMKECHVEELVCINNCMCMNVIQRGCRWYIWFWLRRRGFSSRRHTGCRMSWEWLNSTRGHHLRWLCTSVFFLAIFQQHPMFSCVGFWFDMSNDGTNLACRYIYY